MKYIEARKFIYEYVRKQKLHSNVQTTVRLNKNGRVQPAVVVLKHR